MEYNSVGVHPSSGRFDRHAGDLSTSYNPSVDSYVIMNGGPETVMGGVQLREICQNPAADHHRGWPESAASSSLQWVKMQQQQQQQGEPSSCSGAATSRSASLGAPLSSTAMLPLMSEAVDVEDRRGLLEATTLQAFNSDHEMPSYSAQFGSASFSTQLPFRQQMPSFPRTVPLALVQSSRGNTSSCDDADTVPPAAIVESTSSLYRAIPLDRMVVGGAAGLHSPVAVPKRIRDKSTGKALQHHRKKAEKNQVCLPPGPGKVKLPSLEQPDHIARERQRRDDMANKFAVLESLLPPGSKRDRSTIVSDSADYVKNLHHRIDVLQQRRMEMMNVASVAAAAGGAATAASPSAATSHGNTTTTSQLQDYHHTSSNSTRSKLPTTKMSNPVIIQSQNNNSSLNATGAAAAPPCFSKQVQRQYNSSKMPYESYDQQAASAAACQVDLKKISNMTPSANFPTEEDLRESNAELKSCVEKLDVFPDLPHKLVIQMICRPQPKFQSNVLQGLESLQLEVLQCNISRIAFEHVICIISAKPWNASMYDANGIIVAVKCALGPDSQKQQQTKPQGLQLLP